MLIFCYFFFNLLKADISDTTNYFLSTRALLPLSWLTSRVSWFEFKLLAQEYEHTEALMAEAVEEPKTESKGGSCWNCLGDHTVANCPKPRNPQEIAKNRKAFQNMQARMKYETCAPGPFVFI